MSDQIIVDITPAPVEPVIVNTGQSSVISVNGRYGVVTLTKEDVGLGNVINTSNYLPLSGGAVIGNIDTLGKLLSAGVDLFDIFLTSETDSQTLSFNEANKDLSISSGNTISLSSFTANTDFNSYKTNVASATATLLPTTIYQKASGFWQAASTLTSQASANTIFNGGNTRGADVTIGTNDGFDLRLETNNSVRVNILSSGDVGIGTGGNDRNVTQRLTVQGNINLRGIPGTETRFIEIGTGRTDNGNSYIDLIGDALHADFGTRILREDTGPNANSYIRHKGTGNLVFEAIDAGSLKFFTNSQERGTIDSVGNFSFGNVLPNERLTVLGNISATGVVYAQEGNSTQWNLASNTAINYTHANFLPLTGGIISGETRINNNLTVWGNISATGTTTFANTIFSTTSALSVVHVGSGPAMWVGNDGDGDIASFYDIDSNVEVLHVGGNTGSFPNVGVKTSTPNKDFTVNGEISASNTIYDNVGNSTQWNTAYNVATTYQSASSSFALNTAVASATATLLPLAGGTLTGNLTVNGIVTANNISTWASYSNKDGGPNINVNKITISDGQSPNFVQITDFGIVFFNATGINTAANTRNNLGLGTAATLNSGSFALSGGNTNGSNLLIGTNDNFDLNLATANTTRMTITSAGNVGINTTTPNERLTVNGTISASSTIFSAGRRAVTTNTTTVPGTSAVTSILAVSALPVVQETGVLYILI